MAEENSDTKRAVYLQLPCAELVDKIIAFRKEKKGIVDTKVRIIAEAVYLLAEKEFAE